MRRTWLVAGLLCLALLARAAVLDFVTGDTLMWVLPWYQHILEQGYAALGRNLPNGAGYGEVRGNYTPPYYYLLYLATRFDGLAPPLHLVKSVSMAFDAVAAFLVYRLARRVTASSRTAWTGALAVLLAPTVIANGALWGQCDVIWAAALLAAVYFSLTDRPLWTAVFFGAALSFKASAIFLAPYILMLVLRGAMRWRQLLAVPAVYAAMMAPAALLGRPIPELFLVYRDQARFFGELSMNAPNLYHFVPDLYYREVSLAGVALTVIVALAFALAPRYSDAALTPRFLLLAATASVAMAPFLLPKMHDRYFFAADLASIALAVSDRRKWLVPVLFQCSSTLAYVPIVTDVLNNFEGEYTALTPIAVAINTGLVLYLLWCYGATLGRSWRGPRPALPVSLPTEASSS